MGRREIIYLALSNLITSSLDSLEGIKKLPLEQQGKDEIAMLEYIVSQAMDLEEEYRKEINQESGIARPNWDEIENQEL